MARIEIGTKIATHVWTPPLETRETLWEISKATTFVEEKISVTRSSTMMGMGNTWLEAKYKD
jgi:hypothetical protein